MPPIRFQISKRFFVVMGVVLIGASLAWMFIEPGWSAIITLLGACVSFIEARRDAQTNRDRITLRYLVQIVAGFGLGSSILWLILIHDLEPLVGVIASLIAFAGTFKISDQPITKEMLIALVRQGPKQRQAMILAVWQRWVVDVLQNALFHNILAPIPTSLLLDEVMDDKNQPSVDNSKAHILDAFDKAGGKLLVLGEPGSGKSTQMYVLVEYLLSRAKADHGLPFPVFYRLSSWAKRRSTIEKWLCDELPSFYGVNRSILRAWLESESFQLILDGLDEVPVEFRDECIRAINEFMETYANTMIVVSSRKNEYLGGKVKLHLKSTITLEKLPEASILNYLIEAGSPFINIHKLIVDDPALLDFASSPLNLDLLARTFEGLAIISIPEFGSLEERRSYLFDQYINQMFERHHNRHHLANYDRNQTLCWLGWLAKRLEENNQTLFHLESIQPSWIKNPLALTAYRLVFMAVTGLSGPVIGASLSTIFLTPLLFLLISIYAIFLLSSRGTLSVPEFLTIISRGFSGNTDTIYLVGFSMVLGAVGGTLAGVSSALFFGLSNQIQFAEALTFELFDAVVNGLKGLILGPLSIGGATFVSILWILLTNQWDLTLLKTTLMIVGLFLASLIGSLPSILLSGLFFGLQFNNPNWSWTHSWRGIFIAFIVGLFGSFQAVINESLHQPETWLILIKGMVISGIFSFILGGITNRAFQDKNKPNQGYYLSLQNSVFILSVLYILVLIVISVGFFLVMNVEGQNWGSTLALSSFLASIFGVAISFWGAMVYGGSAALQHSILRILLYWLGKTPFRYAQFLDYASELILMRRVGGSYEFIHPLIRDYFVEKY